MASQVAGILLASTPIVLLPSVWVEHIFGHTLTSPLLKRLPSWTYPLVAAVGSGVILSITHSDAKLGRHPFVSKVFLSMGMTKTDARDTFRALRERRFNTVCQDCLHPGKSCVYALLSSLPKIGRAGARDVGLLYTMLYLRAVLSKAKRRPGFQEVMRTLLFFVATFTTLRALVCVVRAFLSKFDPSPIPQTRPRPSVPEGSVGGGGRQISGRLYDVLRIVPIPLLFGASMFWLKLDNVSRQNKVAGFVLSSAFVNVLALLGLRPTPAFASLVVALSLSRTLLPLSNSLVKACQTSLEHLPVIPSLLSLLSSLLPLSAATVRRELPACLVIAFVLWVHREKEGRAQRRVVRGERERESSRTIRETA